jgi:ABC-type uncharacterized transport system
VVLMRQGNQIYKDLHNLLDNCQALNSTKFKVTYLSPESSPLQFDSLVKTFPKMFETGSIGSGVLLVDGPMPDKEKHNTAYTFVADRKLHDTDRPRGPGEKAKHTFKGEAEIMKEVKFLVTDKQKRKIFVLQGDDEADINNKDGRERGDFREGFATVGVGLLVTQLSSESYDVSGLSFRKEVGKAPPNIVFVKEDGNKKDVPVECQTLIIPGISKKLSQEALDGIDRYLTRGGKLIVFFDVVVDDEYAKMKESGLETLLKGYGVDVTNEFPLRVPQGMNDDARALLAFTPRSSANPLARGFTRPILMRRTARVVKPLDNQRFKAEPILQVESSEEDLYTLEKKLSVLQNPQRYMLERGQRVLADVQEKPIPLALAVTEGEKPRIVVFGDTEFITNRDLAAARGTNYSFVVSSIEWLAGREDLMGTRPKETTSYQLGPEVNYYRMIFLPGWIMLLGIIGLGVGVWMVRRR